MQIKQKILKNNFVRKINENETSLFLNKTDVKEGIRGIQVKKPPLVPDPGQTRGGFL